MICTCGNPQYGFNCVCDHVRRNPGIDSFTCEFCGIYDASRPSCNRCERDSPSHYCGHCGTLLDENGQCPALPGVDQDHLSNEDMDALHDALDRGM